MPLEFDCNFCESGHFLGKSGTCGNNTCLCDEGFSGKDDWLSFGGCQVNNDLRNLIHLVVLVLCLISLVTCVICFIILVRKWRFRFFIKVCRRKSQSQPIAPNVQSFFHSPTPEYGNDRPYRNWIRQVLTLVTTAVFIIFCFGGCLYSAAMLDGSNREDNKTLVATAYYFTLAPSFLGGYLMLLVWFYSVPDIAAYGNLLNMNKYLVKYPQFVPKCLFISGFIIQSGFLAGILIIPLSTDDSETLLASDKFVLINFIFAFLVGLAVFWITMNTMELVFHRFIQSVSMEGNASKLSAVQQAELKQMIKALQSISWAKWVCACSAIVGCLIQFSNLFSGASQIYIFTNMGIVFGLAVIIMPISFAVLEDVISADKNSSSHSRV